MAGDDKSPLSSSPNVEGALKQPLLGDGKHSPPSDVAFDVASTTSGAATVDAKHPPVELSGLHPDNVKAIAELTKLQQELEKIPKSKQPILEPVALDISDRNQICTFPIPPDYVAIRFFGAAWIAAALFGALGLLKDANAETYASDDSEWIAGYSLMTSGSSAAALYCLMPSWAEKIFYFLQQFTPEIIALGAAVITSAYDGDDNCSAGLFATILGGTFVGLDFVLKTLFLTYKFRQNQIAEQRLKQLLPDNTNPAIPGSFDFKLRSFLRAAVDESFSLDLSGRMTALFYGTAHALNRTAARSYYFFRDSAIEWGLASVFLGISIDQRTDDTDLMSDSLMSLAITLYSRPVGRLLHQLIYPQDLLRNLINFGMQMICYALVIIFSSDDPDLLRLILLDAPRLILLGKFLGWEDLAANVVFFVRRTIIGQTDLPFVQTILEKYPEFGERSAAIVSNFQRNTTCNVLFNPHQKPVTPIFIKLAHIGLLGYAVITAIRNPLETVIREWATIAVMLTSYHASKQFDQSPVEDYLESRDNPKLISWRAYFNQHSQGIRIMVVASFYSFFDAIWVLLKKDTESPVYLELFLNNALMWGLIRAFKYRLQNFDSSQRIHLHSFLIQIEPHLTVLEKHDALSEEQLNLPEVQARLKTMFDELPKFKSNIYFFQHFDALNKAAQKSDPQVPVRIQDRKLIKVLFELNVELVIETSNPNPLAPSTHGRAMTGNTFYTSVSTALGALPLPFKCK